MANAVASAEPGIDRTTLFKQIEFIPHSSGQHEYAYSNVRFNIPTCGRRWGKSIAAGHRVTFKSFIPDSYNWIVGPTYKLGEKEFRIVWQDYQKLGLLKHCRKSYNVKQGDMRIQTPWNSIIEVVSADRPDSLLGEGLTHACMSEAARHTRATWEQYIEPALSDLRGSADFPSTPKGYNWYHGMYELGQSLVDKDYSSWTFPSWTNSIRFPGGREDDEILRVEKVVSKVWFDQEYGALFTSMAGSIYDEFNEKIHVKEHTFNPRWPNYRAFDFGFANPFVCLDIQIGPDDTVYVWREYYATQLATPEHGRAIMERPDPDGYHVDGQWGDPRGPDEMATLGLIPGFGQVAGQDVPWKSGVEAIKRLLKSDPVPHLFVDPACWNMRRQLSQLHVKETERMLQDINEFAGDRNIQRKVDDHAADALRYFIGPYFVLGAGDHFSDLYNQVYNRSESKDFFTMHTSMTLGDTNMFGDLLRL